ncbi:uncharacterized protein LOC133791371 [Humulus lupulus]|uniref:uncharacterized protein LOC133791371 n=1 Tax=Humulus lupulus TaxID=3486 RepID=UPI002B40CC4F|nr:uncharacterized protein LOC133791371 [Humulus lupulus]
MADRVLTAKTVGLQWRDVSEHENGNEIYEDNEGSFHGFEYGNGSEVGVESEIEYLTIPPPRPTDFELEEEEYAQDIEGEKNVDIPIDPNTWWTSVTTLCTETLEVEDGIDSEEDLASLASDDDDPSVRKRGFKEYNPKTKWEDFKFTLGMQFGTVYLLRTAIKEYFIQNDREYKYLANESYRVRAICRAKGCPWVLYAHVLGDKTTFRVNTLVDSHLCPFVLNNRHVDSKWVSKHLLEQFRLNPNMEYQRFKELTQNTKFSMISKWTFYRTKEKAMEKLEGTVGEQYSILDDYCKQLVATNPGSTTILKTRMENDKRIFERVYICLKSCKDGFLKGCRPLMGLDGCFLKGYCKGMLLAAVGIDGNNSMFPIAYAVCEKENTDTWTWFCELLKEDLNVDNSIQFTFINDKQKGLENAVACVWEGSETRNCVRHLHNNFKKEFHGLLMKQLLWAAARATTPQEFKRKMQAIKDVNPHAYAWLAGKLPNQWTKSHFQETVKCDMLVNNLCEIFNATIMIARDKPIVTLLEKVRADANRFEVNQGGMSQIFAVDLVKMTCTCRRFELSGIPCAHALACIWSCNDDVMNFIHEYYKKERFVVAYGGVVGPMPSPENWPKTGLNLIQAPGENNLPGRPKKKRRWGTDEPPLGATKTKRTGQQTTCNNCKEVGHYKNSCKKPVVKKAPIAKKNGRPPSKNPSQETKKRRERRHKQQAREVGPSS